MIWVVREACINIYLCVRYDVGHLPVIDPTRIIFSVWLDTNSFTGQLRTIPGYTTNALQFSHNSLTGEMPTNYCNATCQTFTITSNQFTGTLPHCGPYHLTMIWVNDNIFHGSIMDDLSSPNAYTTIVMSNNLLDGPVPTKVSNVLLSLSLERNGLTGTAPPYVVMSRALSISWISYNELSGTIPSTWYGIWSILLNHNHMTGSISSALFQSPCSMTQLMVNNNLLSGNIPPSILGPPMTAILSHNHITGVCIFIFVVNLHLNMYTY